MSGYGRLYATHCANCGVRVMQQAFMRVLIIVQMKYQNATATVEDEKQSSSSSSSTHAEARALHEQLQQQQQELHDEGEGLTFVGAADAAAQQQQGLHEEGKGLTFAEAGDRREQTEKQKKWTSTQTKHAGQVVSVAAAADERTEQTKQEAPGKAKPKADAKNAECDAAATGLQTAASRVPAAIQRKTPLNWSGAITTVVIFMMMTTTAGAAEHGQAQKMTSSQQMQWASKLGEIQQTIDQVGELKRRDRWDQHTEAAEAQRIRTDRAEATLQILVELNLNMRSEMEKRGARVDLGRQMQFMRRLLDAEQQKEQPARVMRQEIPEDSGHKHEHGQKDLNWGKEDVKARQASRRLKLLMRRLRKDERQRERAERDLRNLISQIQDYKQERGEHNTVQQREDTMIKSSDQ